jgi:hypothetical protein
MPLRRDLGLLLSAEMHQENGNEEAANLVLEHDHAAGSNTAIRQ